MIHALLAQVLPQPANVPPLPSPPLLPRLFLEQPTPLAVALVIATIVATAVLNRRGKAVQGTVAAAFGVLVAALIILATAIQTDREKIAAATEDLVNAAAAVDQTALNRMLAPDVRLLAQSRINEQVQREGPNLTDSGWDKTMILAQAEKHLKGQFKVSSAVILETQALLDGPTSGRTQVRIRAVPEIYNFPVVTWWRVTWRKGSDGQWQAIAIEPLDLGPAGRAR